MHNWAGRHARLRRGCAMSSGLLAVGMSEYSCFSAALSQRNTRSVLVEEACLLGEEYAFPQGFLNETLARCLSRTSGSLVRSKHAISYASSWRTRRKRSPVIRFLAKGTVLPRPSCVPLRRRSRNAAALPRAAPLCGRGSVYIPP